MNREVEPKQLFREGETSGYYAIVIMPYSSNIRNNGRLRLSYWSSQSVHAGYHLRERGTSHLVVIPGESVFGKDYQPTAGLMLNYLQAKGISGDFIRAYPNYNNTVTQLEHIRDLQKNGGLTNVLVVACNWHKERVEQVMDKLGIVGDIVEVEAVLDAFHKETNRGTLLAIKATERMKEKDARIRNNRLLRRIWVQKLLGKIFGPRIVDLNDDTYARLKKR